MDQNPRPPPRPNLGSGLKNERHPNQLRATFYRSGAQSQAVGLIPRVRLTYLAGCLHSLGPRPLLEFLIELDAGANLHERLERYAALERYGHFIKQHGGDRLPSPQIVAGGRR
jgi:hypothetical protein